MRQPPATREVLIDLTPKQQGFVEAALSGRYSRLMFGGAIRGGKTYVVLALLFILCRAFPCSRWAIVRKDLPTLRRNTLPTFEKIRPRKFVGEVNKSDWTARCTNGSEILFFPESIKEDPEHNRWRGLEVNGFVLEEANELVEGSFNKAIERSGSWKCPGPNQPPVLILMTCNPSTGYVKRLFYDPWKIGALQAPFFYLPSRIYDNPHLEPAYLQSLESLKITDPVGYKRFVEGDWEGSDDPTQLIKYEWVMAAKNVERRPGKRSLGVDVARYGDDDTVFVEAEGNAIIGIEYPGRESPKGISIDRTAELVQARIRDPRKPIDADRVKVDGVGLGAGVVDILVKNGCHVVEVIGGAKPIERPQSVYSFKNLRSQLWWELREETRTGELCIDVDDPRLVEDLTAPRFSVDSDKVVTVESKDEIKKRLGRSPDVGDAAVYARANVRPPREYSYTPAKSRLGPGFRARRGIL